MAARIQTLEWLNQRIDELEERCQSYKEIGLRLEADIRQQNIAECAKWLDDEQDRFPNEYPLVTGDDMLEHFKT